MEADCRSRASRMSNHSHLQTESEEQPYEEEKWWKDLSRERNAHAYVGNFDPNTAARELRKLEGLLLVRLAEEKKERRKMRKDFFESLTDASETAYRAQVMVDRLAMWAPKLEELCQTLAAVGEGLDARCSALERRIQGWSLSWGCGCSSETPQNMPRHMETIQEQLKEVRNVAARALRERDDSFGTELVLVEAGKASYISKPITCLEGTTPSHVTNGSHRLCTDGELNGHAYPRVTEAALSDAPASARLDNATSTGTRHVSARLWASAYVEDTCERMEARLERFVDHTTDASDDFSRRLAELEALTEKRCSALEVKVGTATVDVLVNKTSDQLHKRINTMQVMLERRVGGVESQLGSLHREVAGFRRELASAAKRQTRWLPRGQGPSLDNSASPRGDVNRGPGLRPCCPHYAV